MSFNELERRVVAFLVEADGAKLADVRAAFEDEAPKKINAVVKRLSQRHRIHSDDRKWCLDTERKLATGDWVTHKSRTTFEGSALTGVVATCRSGVRVSVLWENGDTDGYAWDDALALLQLEVLAHA